MSAELVTMLVQLGLLFSRVGACFMLLPGLSSERVGSGARLFLALAISLALLPIATANGTLSAPTGAALALSVIGEVILGAVTGMLVRVFYMALEFAAATAANCAGYGSIFHQAIDAGAATGPFSELLTLSALVLFFAMDLHLSVITMLAHSVSAMPAGTLSAETALETFTTAIRTAFVLALVLNAPLLAFSIVLNVGLGLLNRLMPQVPLYFFSVPFAMAGGLLILFQSNGAMIRVLLAEVSNWIARMHGLG